MLTTTAAGRVFDHSYCIGMYGMSGLGFWDPVDFALGANGVLYVVNRGGEELGQRISKCTTDHQFLGQFGGFGAGDGQFIWPTSIDLDRDENLYVADEHLQRISIFDKDGKFLAKWGKAGSGAGELRGPSGLAFDREDNLYIVDSLNNRVQKFTKDGQFLAMWGRHGRGDGEFDMPWGIGLEARATCMSPIGRTAGYRNAPLPGNSWPYLADPRRGWEPFTVPLGWRWTRMETST